MADDALLRVEGRLRSRVPVRVSVEANGSLAAVCGSTRWQSSQTDLPKINVVHLATKLRLALSIASAASRTTEKYQESGYSGSVVTLSGFPGTDAAIELAVAIGRRSDEVIFQVRQVGGSDVVTSISKLWHFEMPLEPGAYLVNPVGCGYLLTSDHKSDCVESGLVGVLYSMPVFGLVRADGAGLMARVDTYWDCDAVIEHRPTNGMTGFAFNWLESLGSLRYPRRMALSFSDTGGYVAMAKAYRRTLKQNGALVTLKDKARANRLVGDWVNGIEYRYGAWNDGASPEVLRDLAELRRQGFKVNLFFPKFHPTGYPWDLTDPKTLAAGGIESISAFARSVHDLGCQIKVFTAPMGGRNDILMHERTADQVAKNLDYLSEKRFPIDQIYFDGYSALVPFLERTDAGRGREQFVGQTVSAFQAATKRGIMASAEEPRFWSIPFCGSFIFMDWSYDYRGDQVPIPLLQLVMGDCFTSGLAAGGYGQADWPADRQPHLYELLFNAMPCYNWTGGGVPTRDWTEPKVQALCQWLKLWDAFHKKVAFSEMTSHSFLDSARTLQRVEYANGVTAGFDMRQGMVRVKGVTGFTGDWQKAYERGR